MGVYGKSLRASRCAWVPQSHRHTCARRYRSVGGGGENTYWFFCVVRMFSNPQSDGWGRKATSSVKYKGRMLLWTWFRIQSRSKTERSLCWICFYVYICFYLRVVLKNISPYILSCNATKKRKPWYTKKPLPLGELLAKYNVHLTIPSFSPFYVMLFHLYGWSFTPYSRLS